MSAASEIFEKLNNLEDLETLISERQNENLHLEFKRKRNVDDSNLADGLDDNLSKVISGFANSEGGVLVIGIDAPSKGGVDKAPISKLSELEAKVSAYLSRSTSFPVEGIVVKKIFEDVKKDQGYLVLHIPESDLAPHRSQKDHKYYLRIGESFLGMEHFQIADMFGRRQSPKLIPYLRLSRDPNNASIVRAILGLTNNGKSIAKFPYLKIILSPDFTVNSYGLNFNSEFGLPVFVGSPRMTEYRGGVNDVIQCGTHLPVTLLQKPFAVSQHGQLIEQFEYQIFEGYLAAENLPNKKWIIKVPRETIQTLLNRNSVEKIVDGFLVND